MSARMGGDGQSFQPRRDKMYENRLPDPYLALKKYAEPTVCPDCRAVFHKGRWQWGLTSGPAAEHRCPACSRIHDKVPAGELTLSGDYFVTHQEEIFRLLHNVAKKEGTEHPLERIMGIDEYADKLQAVVSYTGIHLTRASAQALRHAFQGESQTHYTDRDGVVHATWRR